MLANCGRAPPPGHSARRVLPAASCRRCNGRHSLLRSCRGALIQVTRPGLDACLLLLQRLRLLLLRWQRWWRPRLAVPLIPRYKPAAWQQPQLRQIAAQHLRDGRLSRLAGRLLAAQRGVEMVFDRVLSAPRHKLGNV